MSIAASAEIHPSACIDPAATIGPGTKIGPFVVIEGACEIGEGCIISPHAQLIGPMILGPRNQVGRATILGDEPQHLTHQPCGTMLQIGSDNVFREHVTIHRGTQASGTTIVGSNNYFMVGAHVGHDSVIGNHCVFVNSSMIGGHCYIEDRFFLSGSSAVHQFGRVGRLSMVGGCSTTTKDVLPFIMIRNFNEVVGVNVVGMKRAGMTPAQIQSVRRAFSIIYRMRLPLFASMARLESEMGEIDVIQEMLAFARASKRGIHGSVHVTGDWNSEAA